MMEPSKEYATALFMIAAENNSVQDYLKKLELIDTLIKENPEYTDLLESPALHLSERLAFIDNAFGEAMPEYIISFLKILCENGRIREICDCINEFRQLVRISENRTIATVYYVEPLTDEQKAALTEKLTSISGKAVDAVYIQDTSLIGGIKVQIDDRTFDGSMTQRLNKAKGVISE